MDVTTLQGDNLGRVNMNKLKPYQEPETTQAYALQILARHILEKELKAKQSDLPKNNVISPTTSTALRRGTVPQTQATSYPDQRTLDEEDLEIHRIMLEGYYAQPSSQKNRSAPPIPHDEGKAHPISKENGRVVHTSK